MSCGAVEQSTGLSKSIRASFEIVWQPAESARAQVTNANALIRNAGFFTVTSSFSRIS
jgi:hypothetical protein